MYEYKQTNVSHKHILTDGKYFNKTQILHAVKMNPATSESVEEDSNYKAYF